MISNFKVFGSMVEEFLYREVCTFQSYYMGKWAGGHLNAPNLTAAIQNLFLKMEWLQLQYR